MTKAWGPLGWATIHSIAAMYPVSPTDLEKALITRWFDTFHHTIVCELCRNHFGVLLKEYKSAYPNWNASRSDMIHFVLRAHNSVNASINKPIYSAEECLRLLRTNIPEDKAARMRQSYIVYVRKEWSRDMTMTGISAVKHLKDLIAVERDYWSTQSFSWNNITITESVGPLSPPKKPIQTKAFGGPAPFSLNLPKARFSFLSR